MYPDGGIVSAHQWSFRVGDTNGVIVGTLQGLWSRRGRSTGRRHGAV